MAYILIICDWCDGFGYTIETTDTIHFRRCKVCGGEGRRVMIEPASIVRIVDGERDGQQESSDKTSDT